MSDSPQSSSKIDRSTKVTLGTILAVVVLAVSIIQPLVGTIAGNAIRDARRNQQVDMTLRDHEQRISGLEDTMSYVRDAVKRIEYHLGTTPTDQPNPRE